MGILSIKKLKSEELIILKPVRKLFKLFFNENFKRKPILKLNKSNIIKDKNPKNTQDKYKLSSVLGIKTKNKTSKN